MASEPVIILSQVYIASGSIYYVIVDAKCLVFPDTSRAQELEFQLL